MLTLFKKLYFILPSDELFRIFKLSFFLTLLAFVEVFGLALISFLLINIENLSDAIQSLFLFPSIVSFFNIPNEHSVSVFCALIIVYTLATFLSYLVIIRSLNISGQFIGSRVRQKILSYYLDADWMNTLNINASSKISKILNDGAEVGNIVIFSLHLFSRVILCICIVVALLIFNPALTLMLISILFLAYFLMTYFISPYIKNYGSSASKMMNASIHVLNNIFGSVKEIIFYEAKNEFMSKFQETDSNLAYARAHNAFYSQIPKFFIDSIVLITLVLLISVFSAADFSSQAVFASISVFGLAGLKILPSFQNIYYFYSEIIFRQLQLLNVNEIFEDIKSSKISLKNSSISLKNSIFFQNVSFYFEDNSPALIEIDLELESNDNVAIIGPSGSGKSTLLDLILGFTFPQSGKIFFDNVEISHHARHGVRSNFAFVPQKVHLIEGTLQENILLGSSLSESNEEAFFKAISLACLEELVDLLPDGLDTVISDVNPIISGGQRQCIGFARAFFRQRKALILDEATNAMDRDLESKIMKNIDAANFQMLIAITHKGSLLEYFNKICILDHGRIQDYDFFTVLKKKNIFLKKMLEKNLSN